MQWADGYFVRSPIIYLCRAMKVLPRSYAVNAGLLNLPESYLVSVFNASSELCGNESSIPYKYAIIQN